MTIKALALAALATVLAAPVAPAAAQELSFDQYVEVLKARARAEGVSEGTLQRMTAGLTANSRVIELDRGQPGSPTRSGFPSMANYINRHVDVARIRGGRQTLASTRAIGQAVEREYGVPHEVLVAIWGHETNYGSFRGNFDLSRSLATLAWEGRRRELFSREWVDLMKIADRGFSRSQLVGSWAGAFGNPQFLPSVYLRLATDGDGDGQANIFTNRADTLHSIARYFQDAGWRTGQPWGVRASVPANLDRASIANKVRSPVCPRVHDRHSRWMTIDEWRAMGVRPQRPLDGDVMASLFQPDGPNAPAWLLTANYRVILEYNCSNYYAMSVGLLADEIAR